MGAMLCAPIRSQLLCRHGNEQFRVGGSQMQGFRKDMEDDHCVCLSLPEHPDVSFFGVYDGHAGDRVSHHLAKTLHHHIDSLPPDLTDENLGRALVEFDMEVGKTPMRDDGSTCVFALVQPETNGKSGQKSWRVIAVNVGDSRAILVRANGDLVSLTHDHKPSLREEAERIKACGGFVQNDRVDGELAMSRAIGDFKYKLKSEIGPLRQKVIAVPDITHQIAYEGDRLLVFCDGLVEQLTNQVVARFVHAAHKRNKDDPAQVMRELINYSLARGSTDNHSALLVSFENGVGYARPDEFIAGPLSAWKQDRDFVAAYLKNAKAWGQTGESLRRAVAEADASMPRDYKQIIDPDGGMPWWKMLLLAAFVMLVLYCFFDKAARQSSDEEIEDM